MRVLLLCPLLLCLCKPPILEVQISQRIIIRVPFEDGFQYHVDTVKSDVAMANTISYILTSPDKKEIKIVVNQKFSNDCNVFDVRKSAQEQKDWFYDRYGKGTLVQSTIDTNRNRFILFRGESARAGFCVEDKYLFIDFAGFKSIGQINSIYNSIEFISAK